MQGSSELLLWEDLDLINNKAHKAYEMLQAILENITEGRIDNPSRADSQHMNRLMVLADLLYAELRNWSDDINISGTSNGNSNGTH